MVHALSHAVGALSAAAQAQRTIVIVSAPDAGIYAGPGWFRALVEAACTAVPAARCTAWLDCGGDAGAALAALRAGIAGVIFTGPIEAARRLADIAGKGGAVLATERPAIALDLVADFFASPEALSRRCAEAIASYPPIC